MNDASRWRFALAERIGAAYAADPKVQVVMVAGSTGRGTADRYSDLELDIYWSAPPSEDERRAAVARSGATLLGLAEDPDEWEEQMALGTFHAATSMFLMTTMERYLHEVLDEHSTDPGAQMRLYSLLHAQPLVGAAQVAAWRARAAAYPPGLVQAMLQENLVFHGFGYAEEMLAARDDVIPLYDIFVRVERQILGALLALNRIYLPNSNYKSMDEWIAEMQIIPPDLAVRLRAAFRVPPAVGVRDLHTLIDEILALVAAHVPAFDTAPYREQVRQRRGAWDAPPPL